MLLLFNGVNTAAGCMSSQVNYFGEDSAVTAAGVVVDVTQQTQCSPSSSVEQPWEVLAVRAAGVLVMMLVLAG